MGGCCSGFSSQTKEAEREVIRYTSTKVRPSDEDRGRYVGDPYIDMRAVDYIKRVRGELSKDLRSEKPVA